MRPIEFRGFHPCHRSDSVVISIGGNLVEGIWVKGLLSKHPSPIQVGDMSPWFIDTVPQDPDDSGYSYNVLESTVGEFSGILDDNNLRVFEHDVCRCYNNLLKEELTYVVRWTGNDGFKFFSFPYERDKYDAAYESGFSVICMDYIVVTGTIFDAKM